MGKDGWDSGLTGCHFVPCELRGVVVRLAMLKGKNPGMHAFSFDNIQILDKLYRENALLLHDCVVKVSMSEDFD